MAEVKGGGRFTTRQGKAMVMWSFSGHLPSPELEQAVKAKLRPLIQQELMAVPDLAACSQDPSHVAAAVMQKAAPELMQNGIAGALSLIIKLPPGASPGGAAASQAAPEHEYTVEFATDKRHPDGSRVEGKLHCVFTGPPIFLSTVEAETTAAAIIFMRDPHRDLEDANEQINQMAKSEFDRLRIDGRIEVRRVEVDAAVPAAAAPTPQLTPEQYASFYAERELYPNHVAQISAKYGVSDPGPLDQHFQQQLGSDPAAKQRFDQAYAQYKAWLQSQQQ